eukprot:GHVN01043051.1.p1 GENE.GHVN01043051.1~~GHVN01043051.1.p1  ORF type:complete len:111 (-),score=5.96 GHVN01043051.1:27-359(-)
MINKWHAKLAHMAPKDGLQLAEWAHDPTLTVFTEIAHICSDGTGKVRYTDSKFVEECADDWCWHVARLRCYKIAGLLFRGFVGVRVEESKTFKRERATKTATRVGRSWEG